MKHVNVRLPDDIHEALAAMAEAEDRSLNNMLIVLIKEGQQRRGPETQMNPSGPLLRLSKGPD